MIVSHSVYIWFITIATVGICLGWGSRDVYLLVRHWGQRKDNHDLVFGSVIGLVIALIGLGGILKFHLGL